MSDMTGHKKVATALDIYSLVSTDIQAQLWPALEQALEVDSDSGKGTSKSSS